MPISLLCTISVIVPLLFFTFFLKWFLWVYFLKWNNPYETNLVILSLFCLTSVFMIPISNEKFFEVDQNKDNDSALKDLFSKTAILISYTSMIYVLGNQIGYFENIFTGAIALIASFVVPKNYSKPNWWFRSLIEVKSIFWGGIFTLILKFLKEQNKK